jgi:hypothetical protein
MLPLHIPNIPSSPVKLVVTAGNIAGLNESLKVLSIGTVNTQVSMLLEDGIANHADMLFYHLGDNNIMLSGEQLFLLNYFIINNYNVTITKKSVQSPYPYDSCLNAARFGQYLIGNPKTMATEIMEAAKLSKLVIIKVNQGYTKCNVCVVNENTIITEDIEIKHACESKGIDVLLIQKGSVKLRGYKYGFIGGCTGLIDKNKLAFCGNYKTHNDYKIIKAFLYKHDVEPISLINGDLQDIGGILPIMQEN